MGMLDAEGGGTRTASGFGSTTGRVSGATTSGRVGTSSTSTSHASATNRTSSGTSTRSTASSNTSSRTSDGRTGSSDRTSSGRTGSSDRPAGGFRGPLGGGGEPRQFGGRTSLGGLVGRLGSDLAARARAVSRGPGVLEGTRPGSSRLAQERTGTSLGVALGERYGLDAKRSSDLVREMARTNAGEVGGVKSAAERAAASRTMFNRLDVAEQDPDFEHFSIGRLLDAYDANGRRVTRALNSGYLNSEPGTKGYAQGLHDVATGAATYGPIEQAPKAVQDATHYLNERSTIKTEGKLPGWAQDGTKFGAHTFYSPDTSPGQVADARQASLQQGAAPAVASNTEVASTDLGGLVRNLAPTPRRAPIDKSIPTPRFTSIGDRIAAVGGVKPEASKFQPEKGPFFGEEVDAAMNAPPATSGVAIGRGPRGLNPAAGPIANPGIGQLLSQNELDADQKNKGQTAVRVHDLLTPDRQEELASRRLSPQPLVKTASATAVEGRPLSEIAQELAGVRAQRHLESERRFAKEQAGLGPIVSDLAQEDRTAGIGTIVSDLAKQLASVRAQRHLESERAFAKQQMAEGVPMGLAPAAADPTSKKQDRLDTELSGIGRGVDVADMDGLGLREFEDWAKSWLEEDKDSEQAPPLNDHNVYGMPDLARNPFDTQRTNVNQVATRSLDPTPMTLAPARKPSASRIPNVLAGEYDMPADLEFGGVRLKDVLDRARTRYQQQRAPVHEITPPNTVPNSRVVDKSEPALLDTQIDTGLGGLKKGTQYVEQSNETKGRKGKGPKRGVRNQNRGGSDDLWRLLQAFRGAA